MQWSSHTSLAMIEIARFECRKCGAEYTSLAYNDVHSNRMRHTCKTKATRVSRIIKVDLPIGAEVAEVNRREGWIRLADGTKRTVSSAALYILDIGKLV